MGCGAQKEMSMEVYMQTYHPPSHRVRRGNYELSKKLAAPLTTFSSEPVEICQPEIPKTVKINELNFREGVRIGNKSSPQVYLEKQERFLKNQISIHNVDSARSSPTGRNILHSGNPFDVNLVDFHEAVLYQGPLYKFYYNEPRPFSERYLVVTKSAVRIYESRQKALSIYGRPIIAVPLSAIRKVERTKYDVIREDIRFENIGEEDRDALLTRNMFEFLVKDEFLPIYTHQQYAMVFRDTSIVMEMSPGKRLSQKGSQMSPFKNETSTISKRSSQLQSPGSQSMQLRQSQILDLHKKTGVEVKPSPGKISKITMKYINPYVDVGPQLTQKPINYEDLVEMAKELDKKDTWVRSDLRLIFALEDSQTVDEAIEKLEKIVAS